MRAVTQNSRKYIQRLRSDEYLDSSLEFLMLPQKSFCLNQWCPQFGTGVEHSLAIPNPADNLAKNTELITNFMIEQFSTECRK